MTKKPENLPIDRDTMKLIRGIYPDSQINYYVKLKKKEVREKNVSMG